MTFQFVNRIWISRFGKRNARKAILLSLAILIWLLTLFQIIMEGVGSVNWMSSVLVPILLVGIGMMGGNRGGYTTADCCVEIQPGKLSVSYPAINRYDKRGVHEETNVIEKEDIQEIQYSESLRSFRIIGIWSVLLPDTDAPGVEYMVKRDATAVVLYPPEDQIRCIYSAVESVLGVVVVSMDG